MLMTLRQCDLRCYRFQILDYCARWALCIKDRNIYHCNYYSIHFIKIIVVGCEIVKELQIWGKFIYLEPFERVVAHMKMSRAFIRKLAKDYVDKLLQLTGA
jgi:hypothetical protein